MHAAWLVGRLVGWLPTYIHTGEPLFKNHMFVREAEIVKQHSTQKINALDGKNQQHHPTSIRDQNVSKTQ